MKTEKSLEVQIKGMDCADCTNHVHRAICELPDVTSADVLLGAEKAVIHFENTPPKPADVRSAVQKAGYEAIFADKESSHQTATEDLKVFGRSSILIFIGIVLFVLAVTILGERLGWISRLQNIIPWYVWLSAIAAGGWTVFKQVFRALSRKRIISHTLMTASMLTAIIVGEWATALLIVIFMRLGDFIEKNTTEKAREAVHMLREAAPQTAHLIENGRENEVAISALKKGDIVQVKPGESIPVDGIVLSGEAVVDQSTITGESMPVVIQSGNRVHAATTLTSGSVRIKTTAVGKDSLFGHIVTMVEEAEANRGDVQRLADRFSSIYLPIVIGIAAITYIYSGNVIAAAAVMAVSCSCSFSLATPVAMLASIGTAAQEGLLFKGGKFIEELVHIDTVFIDKTGTLTLGKPMITDIQSINGFDDEHLIYLAASVEQFSEHPLATAVLRLAENERIALSQADHFSSQIGKGVSAHVDGDFIQISNKPLNNDEMVKRKQSGGNTHIFIHVNSQLAGVMHAEDTLRPDAQEALSRLRKLGLEEIILMSGDNSHAVKNIADQLDIAFRAEMQPDEKIAMVKEQQKAGRQVMMIGDGVNDAPALAQADIGIAMGASGTDIAMETAHIVLLREDWSLIPEALMIAKRTMRIVRLNIFFTAIYNLIGLTLAAVGLLTPAIAAAMQSIPDVGIMANSARLLQKEKKAPK